MVTNTKPSIASFIAAKGLGVVRDGWDENDLIEVINNYDHMHEACVREGKELTNVACARKMISIHHAIRRLDFLDRPAAEKLSKNSI